MSNSALIKSRILDTELSSPRGLSFRIIDNSEEFESLHTVWNRLVQRSSNRAITQTWEWLYTWWEIYGDERYLFIILGSEGEEIIGIAPLSIHRENIRYFKLLPYKTAGFLGSGRTSERNVVSDYLDLIIREGREKDFIDGLVKCLSGLPAWDEIILENVSAESPASTLLHEAARKNGLNFQITKRTPSILIKLPDTWDEYLQSIQGSLRYKITRGRKEFNKLSGTYHVVQHEHELSKAFDDLEALHQHRWQGKGQPGAFFSRKWKAFHKKLIPLAFNNGWLKLCFLHLENRPVAANYNFAFDNKIHFFQAGLIPHENTHVRLGLLLHSYCIEEAIHEGYKEYDFLKIGGQGAGYKEMWENYSRDLLEIRISRRSTQENMYRLLTGCYNLIRRGKHEIESKIKN
ncbi:MAG: GNAT family N-acetyltransferase [bacterium]